MYTTPATRDTTDPDPAAAFLKCGRLPTGEGTPLLSKQKTVLSGLEKINVRYRCVAVAFAAAIGFALLSRLPALAGSDMPTTAAGIKLQNLWIDGFHRFLKEAPEAATFLGDYSHDGELSEPGLRGLRKQQSAIAAFERALNNIDPSHMTLTERNDSRLLRAFVKNQKRNIAEAKEGKDAGGPALAIVGLTFTMILHKDEQDQDVWWDHMISRLEKAPAWLTRSRSLIKHPGKLQASLAAKQLAMAPGLYTFVLTPLAAGLAAEKKARFIKARDGTVAVLTAWNKWLTDNAAGWPVNYAMGAASYDNMLKDEMLLPYDSNAIARIGQKTLDAAIADEKAILAEAKAKRINLADPVQAAGAGGGATPTEKTAEFAFFQTQLDTLTNFIKQKEIVSIPGYMGRMKIEETPGFLQPVLPGPSMNAPPLLSKEADGIYFIPPANPMMASKATGGAIFEDFDRDRVLMTSGHEGLPGHFLQLSIAKHNPNVIRRLSFDGVFAEGWAFYEEDLLKRLGLYGGDIDGRYAVVQFERLRGARAVVDTKLASGEWTLEKAIAWFKENAGVDAQTAEGEVSRHALHPGQAFDYAVGKEQIEELLTKYKAKKGHAFTLKAFHDDLLSHGTVPVSIVASEMLTE